MFSYYCKKCGLECLNKKNLKLHWILNCPEFYKTRVKCAYCKNNYFCKDYLKEHWKIYCREYCQCKECTAFFTNLPVKDGYVNDIYVCMLSEKTIDLDPKEFRARLKHFKTFEEDKFNCVRFFLSLFFKGKENRRDLR